MIGVFLSLLWYVNIIELSSEWVIFEDILQHIDGRWMIIVLWAQQYFINVRYGCPKTT